MIFTSEVSQESSKAGTICLLSCGTMTFDPHLLHFRLVNPSEETLEAGLSRELLEELGVSLPISVDDHVESCHAPASSPSTSSPSHLITHFYVKKMEEEQVREVERAAVSVATDHGQEVTICVFIPLIAAINPISCYVVHHLLSLCLSQGSRNGQSSPSHPERRRRPRILPVALFHRKRSLSAGRLSAALQPGRPRGVAQSPHTLSEDTHTHRRGPESSPRADRAEEETVLKHTCTSNK